MPNAATKNVAHGITGMDYVVQLLGTAKSTTQQISLPYVIGTGSAQISFQIDMVIEGANIRIRAAENNSQYTTCYVTIYYTKT